MCIPLMLMNDDKRAYAEEERGLRTTDLMIYVLFGQIEPRLGFAFLTQ